MDIATQNFIEKVFAHFDEKEVIELTKSLVAIPSYDPEGERQCAQALGSFLTDAGLEVAFQEVENAGLNVVARLPGESEQIAVLYNGHLDTVPPSDKMPFDPFTATEVDGSLWGRGTMDMKGGVAAIACALKALCAAGLPLKQSVVFTAVAGEERGNLGTMDFVRRGIQARWAIIGEATGLNIVNAHKGVDRYEVVVKGRAAHGSMPELGVNAILHAGSIIHGLRTSLFPRVAEKKHPQLGAGTYNIGIIQGGMSRNTVPDRCVFKIGKRYLPGETPATIREELQAAIRAADPQAEFELVHEPEFDKFDHLPLYLPQDDLLCRSLAATIARFTDHQPVFESWGAFTDGALIQAAGIPTVIFGPGDVALAHCDDERIPIDAIVDSARVFAAFSVLACSADDPAIVLAKLGSGPQA